MAAKEFTDFKLLKSLHKAIAAEQFRVPTPIQVEAIPKILDGRDVLGVAQTGTGKTAAFALPILNGLGKNKRPQIAKTPRALVLAPTRELVAQIADQFQSFSSKMHIRLTSVYGGVNQQPQVRAIRKGVHIVVATPGRLIDLLQQGHIELDRLDVFVLDEADRMLDMGFLPDLKKIIRELPDRRQSLFFSATMPDEIKELADDLLHKPVKIDVTPAGAGTATLEAIDQRVMFIEHKKKLALLTHILKRRPTESVLVFTRTKHTARRVAKQLVDREINADAIHGDRAQKTRARVIKDFRKRQLNVLVATDIAARGIDIDRISHVINYDLPKDPDTYVHRIGRTARAGAEGTAISFCVFEDLRPLNTIEQAIDKQLTVDCEHPYHVPGLLVTYEANHNQQDDSDE